jgi:flagellar biosynthesis/type III secretory pathway protein FliH
LDLAIAAANQVNLEDLESCVAASERLHEASVDLEAQLSGNAAAEGTSAASRQANFTAYTVGLRPAKERLTAAIKLLKQKQLKMEHKTASNTVGRALATTQEVMLSEDPVNVDEIRRQLSARACEMEVAAAYIEDY